MKKRKYKVLVLLDLKENLEETLNYTTKLSKLIDADLEFFCVKKPTEIVNTDSQLSAMRSINRDCVETDKQIKQSVKPIADNLNSAIKTSFAFGNVKAEIENRLNNVKPDIVVLGKRKQKVFNLTGDNITNFVSQKHNGTVLIASADEVPLNLSSNIEKVNNSKGQEELV